MKIWKVLGLAGVAAAGVVIAREQRQRTKLAPEEIGARLHERLEQAPTAPIRSTVPDVPVSPRTRLGWLSRRPRRHTAPRVR